MLSDIVIKISLYMPWYMSCQEFINQDVTLCNMVHELSSLFIKISLYVQLYTSYQSLVMKISLYMPWYMSYQEFINQDFILCTMVHELSEIRQ